MRAIRMKHPDYSDTGWIRLTFTDGTSVDIVAGFGQWDDGKANDEYPTNITVCEINKELIPAEDQT